MESDTRRPKNKTSFSERIAAFLTNREPSHFPLQNDVVMEETRSPPLAFQNQLPLDESDIRRSFIRWQYHKPGTGSSLEPELRAYENSVQTLLLPTTVICIPIALLASTLLALVYMYKVEPAPNLFKPPNAEFEDPGFVLVNFSASEYPRAPAKVVVVD